jgi:hypothetical protein
MDSTVLVIAFVMVGMVSGRLLMRRFPTVTKAQVFCATVAWIGGVLIAGRPGGSQFWHYTGLTIAVVMGSFLLFALLRRWNAPGPTSAGHA